MPAISVTGDTNIHGGAPFDSGLSSNVKAGGSGIALVGQTTSSSLDSLYDVDHAPQHSASNQQASVGSSTVFANNKAVHRVGDARIDGTTSGPGISTVTVG